MDLKVSRYCKICLKKYKEPYLQSQFRSYFCMLESESFSLNFLIN